MFPGDNLVPQTAESSVPYCYGCPEGQTLVYDHCKNHPEWVDVGMLPDYPRRVCGVLDGCMSDVDFLKQDMIYLQRSECNTYVHGAEENVYAMYAMMTDEADKQIKFVDSCETAVTQSTDEMCIQHVLPGVQGSELKPPRDEDEEASGMWQLFDQTMYLDKVSVKCEERSVSVSNRSSLRSQRIICTPFSNKKFGRRAIMLDSTTQGGSTCHHSVWRIATAI